MSPSTSLALPRRVTRDSSQGGFTFVELLVVVMIIGVLATIALPTFLGQRVSANDAAAKSDARNLAQVRASFDSEGNPSPDLGELADAGFGATTRVRHGLCQDTEGNFAVAARHAQSSTIYVVDGAGRLVESTAANIQDALSAVMLVDCSVAPQFYDAD